MVGLISNLQIKANTFKDNLLKPITRNGLRKRLQVEDFTIVSSNCIGSKFYQELEFPYNTPFVGLFINAPCYIKLLGDLKSSLKSKLTFIHNSKYEELLPPEKRDRHYPVGVIGDGIEIHFLHYHEEEEARSKWERRIERMKMDNLYVTFTDRDFCNEILLNQFDKMDYKRKVCFTAKKYPSVKSSVWINEYKNELQVGDLYTEYYNLRKHFDFVNWLNGGTGRKTADTIETAVQ